MCLNDFIYQFLVVGLIFSCSFSNGHSRDVSCFGLLAKEQIGKKTDVFAHCCNFSVYVHQNTTFCLPVLKSGRVDIYVDWYSQIAHRIAELSPNFCLLYGQWSIQGLKENEDFVYNSTTLKSYYPTLSTVIARAAVEFIHHVQWERVAVITDISNAFFLHIAETFYKNFKSRFNVQYFQLFHSEVSIDRTLNEIQKLKLRIIIVSLPLHRLNQLMYKRLSYNMIWPDYAWLVIGLDQQTFLELTCNDQIIVFLQRLHDRVLNATNFTYTYPIKSIFMDSSRSSVCKCQQFNSKTYFVDIYHFSKNLIPISKYSVTNGLSSVTLSQIPSDLPLQSSLTAYIIFSLIYLPIFIILTVTLLLYLRFRNEPEVKATGVSLNILIFIACYLLLVYPAVLSLNLLPNFERVNLSLRNFFCFLLFWTNGLSFPTALILSILLVKLVRVYRVFNYYGVMKKWECHDVTLMIYVLLLMIPFIIICIVLSIPSGYVSGVTYFFHNGQFIAFLNCKHPHYIYWYFGQPYLLILSVLLIVMAMKTRKIKHENFKDTKKVIALMTIVIIIFCLGTGGGFLFFALGFHYLYIYALHILGQCSLIMLCIIFLFLPKLYPIIKQKISLKLAK